MTNTDVRPVPATSTRATGTTAAFLHAWWACVACYAAAAGVAAWLRGR